MSIQQYFDTAKVVIQQAGKLALKYFRTPVSITNKLILAHWSETQVLIQLRLQIKK